jgi:hypothetical protein
MKTIILSDINNNSKSFIPYGLNIGKFVETKVDILHLLDPRLLQSPYSPHSDSQTFTPAEKLSQHQILEREKSMAATEINVLLSKEASRLNYPLRINPIIEVTDVETALTNAFAAEPDTLIVSSTVPSSHMLASLSEVLEIAQYANNLVLVIPPGLDFHKPKEGIMVTDFSDEDCDKANLIFGWLKPFDPLIYACSVTNQGNDQEMELRIKKWMELVKPDGNSKSIFKTGVMLGEIKTRTLPEYVELYTPDLVILPRNKNVIYGDSLFSGNTAKILVESLNRPVLFY